MTVQWLVSYTHTDGSTTIGAIGSSLAEAISAMCDQLGESYASFVSDTMQQFAALDDSMKVETLQGSADPFRPADAGTGVQSDSEPPGRNGSSAGSSERSEDLGDSARPTDGTGATAPVSGGGTTTPETCAICGTGITGDQAVASQVMHDEPRCKGCSL